MSPSISTQPTFLVSEGYVREGRLGLSHTDYAQVSKRWKDLFTQKDILFYCARIISPKPCFGLPPAQLEGIIKRQARFEIGQPVITATLKDLSWSPQDREDEAIFSYYDVCNGKLAYLQHDTTYSVLCVNLWTGEREVFTIEESQRASRLTIHLSAQLLAVRLVNGSVSFRCLLWGFY